VILLLTACGPADRYSGVHSTPKWSRSSETVKIPADAGNPMSEALNILGLTSADLLRPKYLEAGYNLAGRIPLIDQVAESPFILHQWADTKDTEFRQAVTKSLVNTLSRVVATLSGGELYSPAGMGQDPIEGGFQTAYQSLHDAYATAPARKDLAAIDKAGFSPAFNQALGKLLTATAETARMVQIAFAALDPAERSYLFSRPERYFFPIDNQFNFLTAPTHIPEKVLPMTRKIDFVSLYTAALTLAAGVDNFTNYIQNINATADPAVIFADGRKRSGTILSLPSPIGNLIIKGQGQDVDMGSGDAAIWIDLGGNDRYTGRTSARPAAPGGVSLLIDIEGNDVYDTGRGRYSQGFGCLSIGMLVDMTGQDKYRAGNMAQGCGIYGVGVLMDLQGRDIYRMGLMGQGFGLFGTGLLIDADGSDRYIVNGMGQGTGSTLGFGGLFDLKGNDKYLADRNKVRGRLIPDKWSHVQGAGLSVRSPDWTNRLSFYGGIGFLSDGAGNDLYYASDGNSMGSSYFMSIGALVDSGGSDKYISQNGHAIGFAVHLSNGVLIDRGGDDQYLGSTYTGGAASDRSAALLVDYSGNDVYGPDEVYAEALVAKEAELTIDTGSQIDLETAVKSKMATLSFGSAIKPKAIGMLIDYHGNDRYYANPTEHTESVGGVVPPSEPQDWSHAVILDLNGKDYYNKKGRKDNHYHKFMDHGLCYDTEVENIQGIARKALPHRRRLPEFSNALQPLIENSPIADELEGLLSPDLFVRAAAMGRINAIGDSVVPILVAVLAASGDGEFNRDLLEALNIYLLSGRKKPGLYKHIGTLLESDDPFVRNYAARKLGFWKVKSARETLVEAATDKNDRVRTSVIWALGRVFRPADLAILISAAMEDPSIDCRRAAVAGLAHIAGRSKGSGTDHIDRNTETLLALIGDADEVIRTVAVRGLRYSGQHQIVVTALQKRLEDPSAYVVRAAATSLILNSDKSGIPHLIETLRFPSIDTFEHYDQEVQKDLAYYCGVDFPRESRYSHDTWHRWWSENGNSVNLDLNLEIMHRIKEAFRVPEEEKGIAILEALRGSYPENIVVRNRYARFCYEWITYRLLTKRQVDETIYTRCLRLQKKLAELEPADAGHWNRLAYFHSRLNQFDESVAAMESALAIEPGNEGFQTTLKQYKILFEKTNNQ
jgi:tetratricopeptide (TPR) repeat protein